MSSNVTTWNGLRAKLSARHFNSDKRRRAEADATDTATR